MSLILKFNINTGSNSKSLIFTETTGTYNNPNNLTGWGTPNVSISDVASATLSIVNYLPNTSYDLIDITPSNNNVSTTINTSDLKIAGVSIGDVVLPDGLYGFVYTVTMNDAGVYEQTVSGLFLCVSACKIKKLAARVEVDCGCCKDECTKNIANFLEAYTLYQALLWSGACGSSSQIIKNIENLQTFLINVHCNNC